MAKVGIVMGSDSDMPIMAQAADFLDKMGIDYEMTIISAHREPDIFFNYAKSAKSENVLQKANRVEKIIADQGFEVTRMSKGDIKRFLAIYFDASMNGDLMPDYDGEQYISEAENEEA